MPIAMPNAGKLQAQHFILEFVASAKGNRMRTHLFSDFSRTENVAAADTSRFVVANLQAQQPVGIAYHFRIWGTAKGKYMTVNLSKRPKVDHLRTLKIDPQVVTKNREKPD